MNPAHPGDPGEPECAYLATPEELEAVRQLAPHHRALEADTTTEEPKD